MATQVTLNSGSVDSAGSLALKTNGTTTAVTIDTSQNVGIGTASPVSKLHIESASSESFQIGYSSTKRSRIGTTSAGDTQIYAYETGVGYKNVLLAVDAGTSAGNVGIGTSNTGSRKLRVAGEFTITEGSTNLYELYFLQNSSYARIGPTYQPGGSYVPLTFWTSDAERVRIDTSGNLLVGTTGAGGSKFRVNSSGLAGAFYVTAASTTATEAIQIVKYDNNSTTAQVFQKFYINDGAAACGQINANGANTAAFGSTSDSRLKENIVDLPSQLSNIMALRPVEFDYIESEGGGHQIGFIAQEVQAIYPDLVGERADGMFTLTDLNKNDARLIKAIQELKALVDTQASTITQLQADVAALKGTA